MMKPGGFKILAGILAFLAILTIIVTVSDRKKDPGNFRSNLTDIKPSDVTRIEFLPGQQGSSFELVRIRDDKWELTHEGVQFSAQANLVDNFIYQLAQLKARQVVAKGAGRWEHYQVDDSLGNRVKMFKDNIVLADIVVGRMTFTQSRNPYQQQPDALSYIRIMNDENVYSVEGMLPMIIGRDPDDFRDGHVITCEPANLKNIKFTYPADSSLVITKADTVWRIGEQTADSLNTQNFLNNIRRFINRNFEPAGVIENLNPVFEIAVEGDNMEPVRIKAFPSGETYYYVTSSQNQGTVFRLEEAESERLFRGRSYFLP